MLNIRDLRIDPASLGTKKLLVDVAPAYEYKDGKRTDTVTGYRYMGQPAAGSTANFIDVPADAYYANAVSWAVENGITTGVGGGFDPNSTCTRAQIATFLYRLYLSR